MTAPAGVSALGGLVRRLDDGRGVALSALTSLLVRASGLATTLVAMPIALHTLGEARFAAFLMLFGVINWLILGNLGIHSALGRMIAHKSDDLDEGALLGAALVFALITSLAGSVIVSAAFLVWLNAQGAGLGAPRGEILTSGFLMVVLMTGQIVLQVFEGVQIGRLQMWRTNLIRLTGSAFTFVCLLVLPRLWNSMMVFVVALSGGLLLSAALNGAMVVRELKPRFAGLRRNLWRLRELTVSGLAFVLIGLASLVQTQAPLLILASQHGAASAVDFGLLVRLLMIQMVVLGAVTTPLWPALVRARIDEDRAWLKRSLVRAAVFVCGCGLAAFAALGLFAPQMVRIWTGRVMAQPVLFQVLFGLYFFQMAWSHYWGIVMVGLGKERATAVVLLIEAALLLGLATLGGRLWGPVGVIAGMTMAFAACSFWSLPLMAGLGLRREFAARPVAPVQAQGALR